MYDFIAQSVGILGAAAMILSFQFKNNKTLCLVQGIGGLLFAINFLMLGAYTASVFNFINLARGLVLAFGGKWCRGWWLGSIFAVSYVVVTAFTFDGWVSLLILVAQVASTIALWSRRGNWIRFEQMAINTPAWLTNNIVYFSMGGIITESFCFISAVVSLIRYKGKLGPSKG